MTEETDRRRAKKKLAISKGLVTVKILVVKKTEGQWQLLAGHQVPEMKVYTNRVEWTPEGQKEVNSRHLHQACSELEPVLFLKELFGRVTDIPIGGAIPIIISLDPSWIKENRTRLLKEAMQIDGEDNCQNRLANEKSAELREAENNLEKEQRREKERELERTKLDAIMARVERTQFEVEAHAQLKREESRTSYWTRARIRDNCELMSRRQLEARNRVKRRLQREKRLARAPKTGVDMPVEDVTSKRPEVLNGRTHLIDPALRGMSTVERTDDRINIA